MQHKNDYSLVVFFQDGKVKKWQFVHNLNKFVSFLNQKHPHWKYINVYERRTGKYIKRFYPGNLIPYFLSAFFVALALYFFLTFNNTPRQLTFNNGFNNTATISTILNKKGGII